MAKLKKNIILKAAEHVAVGIIWTIVFLIPVYMLSVDSSVDWQLVLLIWGNLIPFLILFLLNHYVLVPLVLFRKHVVYYLILAVFVIGLYGLYDYFSHDFSGSHVKKEFFGPPDEFMDRPGDMMSSDRPPEPPDFNNYGDTTFRKDFKPKSPSDKTFGKPPDQGPPSDIFGDRTTGPHGPGGFPKTLNVCLIAFLLLGFDTGIKIAIRWTDSEKQKAILEKENTDHQLAMLKNQVSPHFFMNTLNNIHSLIDINEDEAKEAVVRLSKLMRYLLYESDEQLVPVTKEVEFIQSYVDLMKLRYSEKVKVKLNISGNIPDKKIPPLLFLSLIENAFKHGISYREESYVVMDMKVSDNELHFVIRNGKPSITKITQFSGIGVQNTKKRLDLLFGNRYKMDVFEDEDTYIVKLIIPL